MNKGLIYILIIFLSFSTAKTEVLERINIQGNKRVSNETIKIYGNIEIGKDYSEKTIKLMQRVASRMLKPGVWDQAEFNNELWTPSGPHGDVYAYETWLEEDDRVGLNCAVRIMPFTKVCNSKVWLAHPEYHKDAIVVHFNYHSDKEVRMNTLLKERYGIEY